MAVNDGDVLTQVITFTTLGGDEFQNKFTWEYSGTSHPESGVIASLDGWAEDFYELMATYLKDSFDSFVSEYNKIVWNSETSEWEVSENIGVGSGAPTFTDVTELLPFQVCPCLIGFTDRPKTRGRKFIPLFCEDAQTSSNWVSAAYDDIADALAEYLSEFIIETGKAVLPGVASTVTGEFHQFLSGMVKDIVFTQRRRTKGVGS